MLTDILSALWRWRLYVAFALVGLALGAVQVGYGAASVDQPTWLTVTLAVYTFVGTGFGFTAAANTPARVERETTVYIPEHRRDELGRVDLALVAAIVVAGLVLWLVIQVLELVIRS